MKKAPGKTRITWLKRRVIWRTEIFGRKHPNRKSKGNLQGNGTVGSASEVVNVASAVNI